jgi:hypothetical protein
MVRSQKSIAGSVGLALGNAPYKIALCYAVPLASHLRTFKEKVILDGDEVSSIFFKQGNCISQF